jgi:hypothetical protein
LKRELEISVSKEEFENAIEIRVRNIVPHKDVE